MSDKQNKRGGRGDDQVSREVHELVKQIDADPRAADNYLKLATLLTEEGSFDQAAQLLEKAKRLVPKPQDLDYDLAVCYYMQGDFAKSMDLLNQIPNDDLVLFQKALVLLKTGQKQKALAYALTIKHADAKVAELRGDIWLALGDLKEAQASFEQIEPTHRSAKVNFMLGVATLSSDRAQALDYFHRAQAQDNDYYQNARKQYEAVLKLVRDAGSNND